MAAAIIFTLQMLFGASAATQPTSAQLQVATAQANIIVVTDQTIMN